MRACRSGPSATYTSNVSIVFLLPRASTRQQLAMEVVAPLPCNEAPWSALPRHPWARPLAHVHETPRRHRRWPKISLVRLDGKPAHILLDVQLFTPVVIIFGKECVYVLKFKCLDAWRSEELKLTVIPLSGGGLDIWIGSHTFHVRKNLSDSDSDSVPDRIVQMVLSATCDPSMTVVCKDVCAFGCQTSMVPKGILDMALYSPGTKHAQEVYTKRKEQEDGGSLAQGSGAYADNHQTLLHGDRKTCSGGSGPDPESTNMQQQKQQHAGSLTTGVHLWPSEVAPTPCFVNPNCLRICQWEESKIALNSINILGSMNISDGTGCKSVITVTPADCLNKQRFLKDPYQTDQSTNGAPAIDFTEQKGETELYSILGSSVAAQDIISKALKNAAAAAATTWTWIVASAAPHHATGNRALLSEFTPEHGDMFLFGGDAGGMPVQVIGHGVVVTETMVLPDVWYVPGLAANLVSVSQLAELDYSVAFGRGKCYVRSIVDGAIIGAAQAGEDGLFTLDFLRVLLGL